MDSITSPLQFFETVVVPNHRDFKARPDDIRLAMNAAISLVHMADWMFESHQGSGSEQAATARNIDAYKENLGKNCEEFQILRDVANASKHCVLTKRRPRVLSAKDIGLDPMRAGDPVGHSLTMIKVRLSDGSTEVLEWVIDRAIAMWLSELGMQYPLNA